MYCIYTVLPVEMSALILKCNVIVWGFLRGIVKKKKEKAQKHKMFMDPRGGAADADGFTNVEEMGNKKYKMFQILLEITD